MTKATNGNLSTSNCGKNNAIDHTAPAALAKISPARSLERTAKIQRFGQGHGESQHLKDGRVRQPPKYGERDPLQLRRADRQQRPADDDAKAKPDHQIAHGWRFDGNFVQNDGEQANQGEQRPEQHVAHVGHDVRQAEQRQDQQDNVGEGRVDGARRAFLIFVLDLFYGRPFLDGRFFLLRRGWRIIWPKIGQ